VHRVVLDDAPGRQRAPDAGGVVQHHHGVDPGQAGGHHLRPAAEAGEEVRFDEPGGDAQVGLDPQGVQLQRHAVAGGAQGGERAAVPRVVVHDPAPGEHVVAEHLAQLLGGVAPVGAGGHEDHDLAPRCGGVDLLQQGVQHRPARLGPGAVADGDRDGHPGAHLLAQRGHPDGVAQGLPQAGRRVLERRVVLRGDHQGPVLQRDVDRAAAVGEGHGRGCSRHRTVLHLPAGRRPAGRRPTTAA
jgi:hypothetical protein